MYGSSDWPALPLMSELVNKVHCMDALELLSMLPSDSVDCVVTSPPYDNLRTYNGYLFDFELIARETYRVLKPGGVCVWVVGDSTVNGSETLTSMRQALYFVDGCGFRMHDTMFWNKTSCFEPANVRYYQLVEYMYVLSKGAPSVFNPIMKPNRKAGQLIRSTSRKPNGSTEALHGNGKMYRDESPLGNVWDIEPGYMKSTKDSFAYEHPAMFPEELARRHIETWTNAGDLVLDYFGGSGTTAKMARQHGRDYITCDISLEYCDLMRRRMAKPFTPNMFIARELAAALP